ncbi:MAG: hypothetical protein V2A56_03935 [bacterium]
MNTEQSERYEADLSAIVDGELDGEPLRRAIDALVRNPGLRRFWLDSRALQATLHAGEGDRAGVTPPKGLWNVIEANVKPRSRIIPFNRVPVRAWVAAATILLAVGLSFSGFLKVDVPFFHSQQRTIQLASDRGSMTETRFLQLTTELLQADPRYQRKMLEVMQVVNQQAYGFQTGEGQRRGEPLRERTPQGATPDAQTASSPAQTSTSRDNVELRLW